MSNRTIYALVGLTALMALTLGAIAVTQVATRQPINLPQGLTEALAVGVTAIFGGTFFQQHAAVIGSMADLAKNTIPVGNVSPLGTTTIPTSAPTIPSAPIGSSSGGGPAIVGGPPGSDPAISLSTWPPPGAWV